PFDENTSSQQQFTPQQPRSPLFPYTTLFRSPSVSRALLERRAALLACTREFFSARGVLEVDTPVVVNAPVSDVHIVSATVQLGRDRRSTRLNSSYLVISYAVFCWK